MKSKNNMIRNEKGFAEWFKKNYSKFGFSKMVRKDVGVCPDFVLLRNGKEVRVELETFSSNFILHKHSLDCVDEIICLVKDLDLGKPVTVATSANYKLPKTTSFKIEECLWKDVKISCIQKGIDISDYIESLIKKDLGKK